jgi:hypothetical protein
LFEQFAVIGVAARDVVADGGFAGALWIAFGDGYGGGPMTSGETVDMVQTDATRSDDGTTKLVCHSAWEFMSSLHPLRIKSL